MFILRNMTRVLLLNKSSVVCRMAWPAWHEASILQSFKLEILKNRSLLKNAFHVNEILVIPVPHRTLVHLLFTHVWHLPLTQHVSHRNLWQWCRPVLKSARTWISLQNSDYFLCLLVPLLCHWRICSIVQVILCVLVAGGHFLIQDPAFDTNRAQAWVPNQCGTLFLPIIVFAFFFDFSFYFFHLLFEELILVWFGLPGIRLGCILLVVGAYSTVILNLRLDSSHAISVTVSVFLPIGWGVEKFLVDCVQLQLGDALTATLRLLNFAD